MQPVYGNPGTPPTVGCVGTEGVKLAGKPGVPDLEAEPGASSLLGKGYGRCRGGRWQVRDLQPSKWNVA